MSDAFMSDSEEDAGDFSASEDEWLPGKSEGNKGNRKQNSSSGSSAESGLDSAVSSDDENGQTLGRQAARKKATARKSKPNLSTTKNKPDGSNKSGTRVLKSVHDDSASSGDEYLVDPTQLDLNSKFFTAVQPHSAPSGHGDGPPVFDCNAGLGKLSDSSEDESPKEKNDTGNVGTTNSGKKLISKINEMSQTYVNFQDFTNTLEKAKAHLHSATKQQQANQTGGSLDVSRLLALGETGSSVPTKSAPEPKATTSSRTRKATKKPVDSDSDWEEVEENAHPTTAEVSDDRKTVQITLRQDGPVKKKKKCTEIDVDACLIRMINREKRDAQLVLHKMTIIMGIAHGNYTNTVLNDPCLLAIGNGMIPSERCYPKGRTSLGYIEQILKYYREIVDVKDTRMFVRSWKRLSLQKSLRLQLLSQMANCKRDYILLFIILLRSIGVQCRMVMSLQVVPKNVPTSELLKAAPNNIKKPLVDEDKANVKRDHDYEEKKGEKTSSSSGRKRKGVEIPQLDGADDVKKQKRSSKQGQSGASSSKNPHDIIVSPRKTRKQRINESNMKESLLVSSKKKTDAKDSKNSAAGHTPTKTKALPKEKKSDDCIPGTSKMIRRDYSQKVEESNLKQTKKSSSDSPIQNSPGKKIVKIERFSTATRRALDRRILSTDDEAKPATNGSTATGRTSTGVNLWAEVYAEEEERWIPVDVVNGLLQCVDKIVARASSPLLYVLSWNNDGSIKDVSSRYCAEYTTVTQKLRIMQQWMDDTLLQFRGEPSARDAVEDRELNRILEERPLPKTISEYKNHPYFALKRHLLKFEAIYPPDAPTLGFTSNKEPVYARECVHTLHAREVWLKQARTVKLFETPYKNVSARPKYNRATGQMEPAPKLLELFGYWQTEEYEPPTAEDGIVPRNAYGNVELFKPCMLPKKTVHLRLPCLNRICKKLRIDCAQAVTGFDFHGGSSHPVYDGFVVCEEYRDLVVDAWHQEQEAEEQRAREKYEKRVYGNWKRLIKGLLIRRKLQHKYNFDNLNQ
ncbi:DNA repair protein complementing XP-C cells homolog [Anopheles ziemanni]|uniref:DNA repair protein complementing XP-C cells homolog n=1 Tax=Anopheles ziemanni TaxID=345580 RepID=UPI00265DDC7F|nr:DNA repair protein complementing XP-C cells homolog [Anopheles ziemanni]